MFSFMTLAEDRRRTVGVELEDVDVAVCVCDDDI